MTPKGLGVGYATTLVKKFGWSFVTVVGDNTAAIASAKKLSATPRAVTQNKILRRIFNMVVWDPIALVLGLDLKAPFLHDTPTLYSPPPPRLCRVYCHPWCTKGGGGGVRHCPMHRHRPNRKTSTMLMVIMREGLRANLNPPDFHLYQPNMNAVMAHRVTNSHCSRPVTLSILFGVWLDTAALATAASTLRIVPGVLRTVPPARSKVLPIQASLQTVQSHGVESFTWGGEWAERALLGSIPGAAGGPT